MADEDTTIVEIRETPLKANFDDGIDRVQSVSVDVKIKSGTWVDSVFVYANKAGTPSLEGLVKEKVPVLEARKWAEAHGYELRF